MLLQWMCKLIFDIKDNLLAEHRKNKTMTSIRTPYEIESRLHTSLSTNAVKAGR